MEQRMLKLLLIQLKIVAVACFVAMVFFLFVAFSPAAKTDKKGCKHTCTMNQREEDARESFLIGKLFSYSTLETN